VPGDTIDKQMVAKEVGDCDSFPGTLDGIPYDLFALKDLGLCNLFLFLAGRNLQFCQVNV
jgi:hypothetical protein